MQLSTNLIMLLVVLLVAVFLSFIYSGYNIAASKSTGKTWTR